MNTNATLLSSREQQKSIHSSEMTTIREMDNTSTHGIPVYDEDFRNTINTIKTYYHIKFFYTSYINN